MARFVEDSNGNRIDAPSWIFMENPRILWANFSGKEKEFNKEGDRNFCVAIDDPQVVKRLVEDNWNIKIWVPKNRDEDEEITEPINYLKVTVSYKYDDDRRPKVIMITKKHKIELNEETIGLLDTSRIIDSKVTIVPYLWNVRDKIGVTAYLKELKVVIEEDEWSEKYSDIPWA